MCNHKWENRSGLRPPLEAWDIPGPSTMSDLTKAEQTWPKMSAGLSIPAS